jgi:hypothetical protein
MKISLEIHSGDVNNDSGLGDFSIHYFPESLIHISPESLFTISRNDYSHAPEYAATTNSPFTMSNVVFAEARTMWASC